MGRPDRLQALLVAGLGATLALCLGSPAQAQDAEAGVATPSPSLFAHPGSSRFWLSGQANLIFQANPAFGSARSGPNSFRAQASHAASRVLTLYAGVRLTPRLELIADLESAGGGGLSDALGIAGFPNVDVVRNPTLGAAPYLARLQLHAVVPLAAGEEAAEPDPLSLARRLPRHRLELRLGKLSLPDLFDRNSVAGDSHLQFTGWSTVNDGAYDYAADTRGYTVGAVVEYRQPRLAARVALALMPKVANGIDLEWRLGRARALNAELEWSGRWLPRPGVVRVLGYWQAANQGSYAEAVQAYLAGEDPVPDVTAHRRQGRRDYGLGLGLEQPLLARVNAFLRAGWNEGHHESFCYTEVDDTAALGAELVLPGGRGKSHKLGLALVSNGISRDHREYLRLGGLGFLLGDGGLSYGRETIGELYYTLPLGRGLFPSAGLQRITNPGYDRDRGPVWVLGLRLHVEI